MWFIPSFNNDIVGIICNPDTVICSCVRMHKNIPYIYAYEYYLESSCIYAHAIIHDFLRSHALQHAMLCISLHSNFIRETLILNNKEIAPEQTDQEHYWQQQQLSTSIIDSRDTQVYYKAGIKHHLLLQYKLLAAKLNKELMSVTTHTIARYMAYQAYSRVPLFSHHDPEPLTLDKLQHYLTQVTVPLNNYSIQASTQTVIYGLYNIGKQIYEAT